MFTEIDFAVGYRDTSLNKYFRKSDTVRPLRWGKNYVRQAFTSLNDIFCVHRLHRLSYDLHRLAEGPARQAPVDHLFSMASSFQAGYFTLSGYSDNSESIGSASF